jgi:hypothetical protein
LELALSAKATVLLPLAALYFISRRRLDSEVAGARVVKRAT